MGTEADQVPLPTPKAERFYKLKLIPAVFILALLSENDLL
jgi:hypothetical protein